MGQLTNAMMSLMRQVIMVSVIGSILCLVAGEVRLAALMKASKGSSKLSVFSQNMTKTKLKLSH